MKAAQMNGYGQNGTIEINYLDRPIIQPDKVLVKIIAAGVNPIDWQIKEGLLQNQLSFPFTLGGDFAGIIEEVGSEVQQYKPGNEVWGYGSSLRGDSGSFAEYILVDPKRIALKPKKVDFLYAAALPLVAASAWEALVDFIELNKNQKILIHGAAGGIGSIAVQLASFIGAHVAATARTRDFHYVLELGADEIIDYKMEHFETILQNYDAVFDTIGGSTYTKSFKILKKNGIIVSMIEPPRQDLIEQYEVNAVAQLTDVNTERLTKIGELIDINMLKVHVDKVFPINQTAAALTYQQKNHPRGKVVIKVNRESLLSKIKKAFKFYSY